MDKSKYGATKADSHKTSDKPDGPKEHMEAIRFLMAQAMTTRDDVARQALAKISGRLDALEGKKPEQTA
jgi:hypothetical protein